MKRVLLVLLVACAGFATVAQFSDDAARAVTPRKVSLYTKLLQDSSVFSLKLDKKAVIYPGATFVATVRVHHATGWHLYSSLMSPDAGPSPLSIAIPDELSPYYSIAGLKESGTLKSTFDSNFSAVTKAYYGDFTLMVSVHVNENAPVAKLPFGLVVRYMTCSENICLPARSYGIPMIFLGQDSAHITLVTKPKDSTVSAAPPVDTTHAAGTAKSEINAAPPSSPTATPTASHTDDDINKKSLWNFIFAAAGFGLLALLTPCVYPMVPITISFFTKRNAGSKQEALKDASLYALGIIMTFVVIGFALAALFGKEAINRLAASPWANLALAGLFIVFALNLFGLFELGVPSSILTKLNSAAQSSKSRVFSVLIMGFVFSLASFTCTVPFVSTLLITFSNGSYSRPLIGMLVYATVFASPFFFLALFPSLLKSMPRSGGWMNSVKVVMGFLEIAAALKFVSNVDLVWRWGFFSRDLVLAAWISVMVMTTIYLLGRFRMPHDSPIDSVGPIRAMIAVVFLSVGIYLYTGLNSRPLGKIDGFLPPMEAGERASASVDVGEHWFMSYPEALAEARRTHKNLFIDFTGYTCTNCRVMESTVFSKADVKSLLSEYVLAQLYTDNGSALNDSNHTLEDSMFHTIDLPFYAIVSPDEKPIQTFPGYTPDREAFKTFLSAGRKQNGAVAMAVE